MGFLPRQKRRKTPLWSGCSGQLAFAQFGSAVGFQVIANQLANHLGGRQILRRAQLFKRLLFNRINQHRQARSLVFHGKSVHFIQ